MTTTKQSVMRTLCGLFILMQVFIELLIPFLFQLFVAYNCYYERIRFIIIPGYSFLKLDIPNSRINYLSYSRASPSLSNTSTFIIHSSIYNGVTGYTCLNWVFSIKKRSLRCINVANYISGNIPFLI